MNQDNGFLYVINPESSDENARKKYDHLKGGLVGSMLNIKGVENVRKIQKIAVEESRLDIPLIFFFFVEKNGAQKVFVTVSVKNTGKTDGEEVAQLFLIDKIASETRPVKELKGFKKLMIQVGKTVDVTIELTKNELSFYKNKGDFVAESRGFEIMAGGSSVDGIKAEFSIDAIKALI